MEVTKGTRGPIPNSYDNLTRPRKRKGTAATPSATRGTMRPVTIPDPDPDWHPIARMLWDSLGDSGMADFYQQTDWAFAYHICEELSLYKRPVKEYVDQETGELKRVFKRNGQILTAINAAMSALGITEGDRRRIRIELDPPATEEASA